MIRAGSLVIWPLAICCVASDSETNARADAAFVHDSLTLAAGDVIGDASAFGSIDAVAVIPGRIVVLDGMNGRVRLYDSTGTLLAQFGRPGGGPTEFRVPAALGFDSAGRLLVLDRGNGRITTLGVADDTFELIDTLRLPFHATDLCTVAGRVFLLGLHENRYVHEVDLKGTVVRSFEVQASDVPIRAAATANGQLACSPVHIALAAGTFNDLWVFDLTGRRLSHDTIPAYSATVYETNGTWVRPTLPEAGFAHSLAALTWMSDTHLLVQLRRTGTHALEGRVMALGEGWREWRPQWPRVLTRAGQEAYVYLEQPHPAIGVYRVR